MNITFKSIIGKRILVGITYMDKNENIIKLEQFEGNIIDADANKGIIIEKTKSKEIFELPPDLSSVKIAKPGEYRLRSTQEKVINPDLLTTWIMYEKNESI